MAIITDNTKAALAAGGKIFKITTDVDLNKQNITIGAGSTITLVGGTITNGTLTGNKTKLINYNQSEPTFTKAGTWIEYSSKDDISSISNKQDKLINSEDIVIINNSLYRTNRDTINVDGTIKALVTLL